MLHPSSFLEFFYSEVRIWSGSILPDYRCTFTISVPTAFKQSELEEENREKENFSQLNCDVACIQLRYSLQYIKASRLFISREVIALHDKQTTRNSKEIQVLDSSWHWHSFRVNDNLENSSRVAMRSSTC